MLSETLSSVKRSGSTTAKRGPMIAKKSLHRPLFGIKSYAIVKKFAHRLPIGTPQKHGFQLPQVPQAIQVISDTQSRFKRPCEPRHAASVQIRLSIAQSSLYAVHEARHRSAYRATNLRRRCSAHGSRFGVKTRFRMLLDGSKRPPCRRIPNPCLPCQPTHRPSLRDRNR